MQRTSDLRNKSTKKNRRRQSVDALFLYEAHIFRSEPNKRMETPQICHVYISKTRQKQCVKRKISRKSPQNPRFSLLTHAETSSSPPAESLLPKGAPLLPHHTCPQPCKHNKAPSLFRASSLVVNWRRPPPPRVCSPTGPVGLNSPVRNGKRWTPVAITPGNIP